MIIRLFGINLISFCLVLLSLYSVKAGTIFLDTFNWGGIGLEANVSSNYVTRQSGGDIPSSYTESGTSGAQSYLSSNNGLNSPALLQRVYQGTVDEQADVRLDADFGTGSMAGKIWSVLYTGRMVTQNATHGIDGWTGFVVQSGTNIPITPTGGVFGVVFLTDGTFQIYCNGVIQTNATITGAPFLGLNYEVEATFYEPSNAASLRVTINDHSYTFGPFTASWDTNTNRKIEFSTQAFAGTSPVGYFDAFYDNLTIARLPRVVSYNNTVIKIPRPISQSAHGTNFCYDYSPSAMTEPNGISKVWWCGPVGPGTTNWCDNILYATTSGDPYSETWSSWQEVFTPSHDSGKFDANETCDPCVIQDTNGIYYMYYSGLNTNWQTAIGIATSSDGLHWTRGNGGIHLIQWESPLAWGFCYGAGQPSVAKRGSYYYMVYTSIKWSDSNATNLVYGAYALRSTDPGFTATNSVQELQDNGNGAEWITINLGPGKHLQVTRTHPILASPVWDIVYLQSNDVFMLYSGAADSTKCFFMNDMFERQWIGQGIFIPETGFKEARSVIASPDHSLRQDSDVPGNYSINLMAATYIDNDGEYNFPTNYVDNIFFYDIGDQKATLKLPPGL